MKTKLIIGLCIIVLLLVSVSYVLADQPFFIPVYDVDSTIGFYPGRITVEQGEEKSAGFIIANFYADEFTTKAIVKQSSEDIECKFSNTLKTESSSYTLYSGETLNLLLLVSVESSAEVGTETCIVELIGLPEEIEDKSASLIIDIIKRKGVFYKTKMYFKGLPMFFKRLFSFSIPFSKKDPILVSDLNKNRTLLN